MASSPVTAGGAAERHARETAAWKGVRGFNYHPSHVCNALEEWVYRFDAAVLERELGRAVELFPGFTAIRLWLSHDPFFRDETAFRRNFETALGVCARHGLRVVPTLFNNWHSVPDFGGVSEEMIRYWFVSYGREGADPRYVFKPYLDALFRGHGADGRILAWDLCNEPFNSGPPEIYTGWLRHAYRTAKDLGAVQPVGVSVQASVRDLELVEGFSDVLMIHPYFAAKKPWDDLAAFARARGKALLATECCWGALDDAERAAIVAEDLSVLAGRDVGYLAYTLWESYVADHHRPRYGVVSSAGYMAFVHMDGTLRAGHDAFNRV